ncbi:TPA: hypothetical protein JI077_05755 [Acinetobacter baumannii]|nr:hypothetical protein [Acinetobacter baumannii]
MNNKRLALADRTLTSMLCPPAYGNPFNCQSFDFQTYTLGEMLASWQKVRGAKSTKVTKYYATLGQTPQKRFTKFGLELGNMVRFVSNSPYIHLLQQGDITLMPELSQIIQLIQQHGLPRANWDDPSIDILSEQYVSHVKFQFLTSDFQKDSRNWTNTLKTIHSRYKRFEVELIQQTKGFLIEVIDISEPDEMYPKSKKYNALYDSILKDIVNKHKKRKNVIAILSKWLIAASGQLTLKIFIFVECQASDHLFHNPSKTSELLHPSTEGYSFVTTKNVPIPNHLEPNFFHIDAHDFGNRMGLLQAYLLDTDFFMRIGDTATTLEIHYIRKDDKLPGMRKEHSK